MFDVIEYDGYLVDALRILDMGNGRYSTSFNMKDSWWIRYGYFKGEMVDILRHQI